jgi:small ligand-binding sensory domain FIST
MSKLFPVNEHPAERVVRVLVGVALVGLAAAGRIGAWGWIGILPILTGLSGSCVLYTLLGFSTCPAKAPGGA